MELGSVAPRGSDVIFNTLMTHNWGNIVHNSHNFKSIIKSLEIFSKFCINKKWNLGIIIIVLLIKAIILSFRDKRHHQTPSLHE